MVIKQSKRKYLFPLSITLRIKSYVIQTAFEVRKINLNKASQMNLFPVVYRKHTT